MVGAELINDVSAQSCNLRRAHHADLIYRQALHLCRGHGTYLCHAHFVDVAECAYLLTRHFTDLCHCQGFDLGFCQGMDLL